MTNQLAEKLIIEPGACDMPAMHLYGVSAGNLERPQPRERYPFVTQGNQAKMTVCSALWRGYVSTYRLRSDNTLILERLEYPFSAGAEPDAVYEQLTGSFWLDFRESFSGNVISVPFVNGVVVAERKFWKYREGANPLRDEQEYDAKYCAGLAVIADQSMPDGMADYTVYVNGWIRATPSRLSDMAPIHGMFTRLEPGACRVVVREREVAKPDRAESNTVHVELSMNRTITITLSWTGTELVLTTQA